MLKKFSISRSLMYSLLVFLLLISVIPFYLVIVNSTHSSFDIVTKLNLNIGKNLIQNYRTMQSNVNIWSGFASSLIIVIPYTLLTAYFGALTAYGFAMYKFKGNKILFWIVLASMMLPSQLSIIGFYQLNLKLRLINSYLPFIIPGISNATAVFFLRGIIKQTIPDSMIEAARIEGCSEFGIFNRIVLPCIVPGVAAISIFSFVASWNNYMGPLIIMTTNDKYTLPVMISMIKGLYMSNLGAMYLAIALSVLPIIIVFIFLSKYIINGLTMGSEK